MKTSVRNGNRHVQVWRVGLCVLAAAILIAATPIGIRSALASESELVWAKSSGGAGTDMGNGIATLSDGSTLTVGRFQATATFGQGEANETTLTAAGYSIDIFVARHAPDGSLVWAKRAGGTELDEGYAIAALLVDESSIVTGLFRSTATFGLGEANETTLMSAAGSDDSFIAKYGPNGALVWAKRAGGTDFDSAYGISALSDGSSLITGSFQGTATFGQGEPNETTLSSTPYRRDVFVAMYDPDGALLWAKRAGGTESDEGFGISALSGGGSIVTGYFEDAAVFGPGEPNETTLTSTGSHDLFVANYNPDGSLAWAKRAGGTGLEEGNSVAALSDGTALVTGLFAGAATFGSGEPNEITLVSAGLYDAFVAKYNTDGSLIWASRAGGASDETGYGIAAVSDGTALVTGLFNGTATFGSAEPNETTLVAAGSYDVFVARYDADGTLAWATAAGGADSEEGFAVATTENGNAFVTGYFRNTAVFGPGEANETLLSSAGYDDIFVAQFEALPFAGAELEVEIDIKPGDYPNVINLGSRGQIPVAILSSVEFDATEVDPATVLLAGASVAIKGKAEHLLAHDEDVNGDGLLDLYLQVETENLNPDELQDGYAYLTGETYDGVKVVGCDEITIVPPE